MAAVSHIAPHNPPISPIIREMTRSVVEILGDAKIEPLEPQLPHSRPKTKSTSTQLSSRPAPIPVTPISLSSPAPDFQHATPDTKVFDMLRPFCQPIDDLLPGGKVPPELGPVVGERREVHRAQSRSHTHSSPSHPSSPSAIKVRSEHLPVFTDRKKNPPVDPLHHTGPSPEVTKSNKSRDASKSSHPRFSSVPAPSASSQATDINDDDRVEPSVHKPTKTKKRRDTPSTPPPPQKRRRSTKDSPPSTKLQSRPISRTILSPDSKLSRGERRQSEKDFNAFGDEDDDRRVHKSHPIIKEPSKHDDEGSDNSDERRRESRDDRGKRNQSRRTESPGRSPDSDHRRGRRDRKRQSDLDRNRDVDKDRLRNLSQSRERSSRKDRDRDPDRRRSDKDRGSGPNAASRRGRSKPDERNREDTGPHAGNAAANPNTNSEGSARQNTPSSQLNSCIVSTPLHLSPISASKGASDGQRGMSDHANRESCVSQKLPIAARRGRAEPSVVKAKKLELQSAFIASKAKCMELYAKKDYDAYEEEARNTFRLGFAFAVARETELRLSESEFLKMPRKDRNSRRQEIIQHYRYLTKSFAMQRIEELKNLDRASSTAFFQRGVQKAYLRMYAVQRLWDRENVQKMADIEKSIDKAICKKRSDESITAKGGSELSLTTLQDLQRLTSDCRNMIQLLEYSVKDLGEGYEEAGSECQIQ